MTQRIEFDGQVHEFPDDFNQQDIQKALSAPQSSHSLLGVAKTGAVEGVVDTLSLPDTAASLFTKANDKITSLLDGAPSAAQTKQYLANSPSPPVGMGRFGQIPTALHDIAKQPDSPSWQDQLTKLAFSHVQRDDAQTSPEKFLQAIARAGTGAAMTGGLGAGSIKAAIPAVVTGTVAGGISGAASEGAGQLTAGTQAEPYARFIAGLILGGGSSAALNKVSTAEGLLNRSLSGYTAHDFRAARDLMQQSEEQGIHLTGAEALAQVRGGNTGLMSLQRYTEQMPSSAPTMQQFLQQRPALNSSAVKGALDNIGTNYINPTEVGPGIQAAAQRHLTGIRQDINAVAKPYYDIAQSQSDQLVGHGINAMQVQAPQSWQQLMENPAFNQALKEVRSNPLNDNMTNLPDYDFSVLNAVKKRMDFNNGSATKRGVGVQLDTETAAAYKNGVRQLKNVVDAQFPTYQIAREIGAKGREQILNPEGRAPIGQLAKTEDTVAQQEILSPKLFSTASPQQVGDAVRTLVNNGAHAEAQQLVRMKLQDMFDTALPNVKGNAEQYRGANFANAVTRHQNARESLREAVQALPGGQKAWPALQRTINGLTAQGQRMPVGSPTEFNRLISQAASNGSGILSSPLRGVQGLTSAFKDAYQQYVLGSTAKELAQRLTSQDGGAGLLRMTQRPARNLLQQGTVGLLNYSRLPQ